MSLWVLKRMDLAMEDKIFGILKRIYTGVHKNNG